MIHHYSRSYFPPAPVIEVVFVSAAEGLRTRSLRAFVDSGADGTIVPVYHLEEIHAPATTEMSVRSQWGERRRVVMYLVDVQIGDLFLTEIEVVGDELSHEIVLGRDVLNQMQILLDGPHETTRVFE